MRAAIDTVLEDNASEGDLGGSLRRSRGGGVILGCEIKGLVVRLETNGGCSWFM